MSQNAQVQETDKKVSGIMSLINGKVAQLAGFSFYFMAFLVTIATLSRKLFGEGMPWVIEISEYILFVMIFLAGAWVLQEDGHTRFDLITRSLPEKVNRWLKIFTNLLLLVLMITLFIFSIKVTYENYLGHVLTMRTLRIPKYVPLLALPISFLLLGIQSLIELVRSIVNNDN